jgi:hypothetical protein
MRALHPTHLPRTAKAGEARTHSTGLPPTRCPGHNPTPTYPGGGRHEGAGPTGRGDIPRVLVRMVALSSRRERTRRIQSVCSRWCATQSEHRASLRPGDMRVAAASRPETATGDVTAASRGQSPVSPSHRDARGHESYSDVAASWIDSCHGSVLERDGGLVLAALYEKFRDGSEYAGESAHLDMWLADFVDLVARVNRCEAFGRLAP